MDREDLARLGRLMQEASEDAVRMTEAYFGGPLDYSEASIQIIDTFSDDLNYALPQGKTPDSIALMSRLWGAYLGEVFRTHVGGHWETASMPDGTPVTVLQCGGMTLIPHDKVYKRIMNGSEDNLWQYYQVFRNLLV